MGESESVGSRDTAVPPSFLAPLSERSAKNNSGVESKGRILWSADHTCIQIYHVVIACYGDKMAERKWDILMPATTVVLALDWRRGKE